MHKIPMIFLVAAVVQPAVAHSDGAVLSQVRGDVQLQTVSLGGPRYPARPLQIVAPGSTLILTKKSEAVVICADDRALQLIGPEEWRPGTASCQGGRRVAQGTYARLLPSQGRVRDFHGSLLTEAPSRSDNEGSKVPVLVRPRSPQRLTVFVGEASPTLVWTAVSRALWYELVLNSGSSEGEQTFRIERPDCRDDSHDAITRACTVDWPWSPLRPGEEVELRVRVRTPDPDRPERATDASKLRLADAGVRSSVKDRLAALTASRLPAATDELLRADIYAEAQLFNEAADALVAALEDNPNAAVAVRLADLYLGLGQLSAALKGYGRAEQLLPSSGADEIRAALYLGRGRFYARSEKTYLAAEDLKKAVKYFRKVGYHDEARVAEVEAERASRGEL